jgi:hypothetical protein
LIIVPNIGALTSQSLLCGQVRLSCRSSTNKHRRPKMVGIETIWPQAYARRVPPEKQG